ncbi:MAG: gamma-glutamylcyclotransferase family protein [Chloroflexota bacterium]
MTEQIPFFVYGTLLPGQPNDHLWQENAVTQEEAVFVNGRLYDMGFYPMLVEEEGHQVQGMVLTVRPDAYVMVVQALDNLEGFDPLKPDAPGYRRVAREVVLGNGRSVRAWVYMGQSDYVEGYFPIAGGDWRQHADGKLDDMTDWWDGIDTVLGNIDENLT